MSEELKVPSGWKIDSLENFMVKGGGNVDPSKYPNEQFDLYSIPAYDSQIPELARGSEIGSTKKVVQENDVLLSRIVPHIQRSWVVGKDVGRRQIGSGEWVIFRGNPFVPKYMRYFLLSYDFHMKLMTTISGVGGSLTRANPNLVGKFIIPLPPLPEQKAIVARIEQLLSDLENGKQQLQTAQQQLKIYRQSLLKAGFEGKLTNKNVKEGELPKGWKWVMPTDIASPEKYSIGIGPFGSNLKVSDYKPSGVPLVFVKNITRNDFTLVPRFVSKDKFIELKAHSTKPLDILITKMGDPPGDCTIYPASAPEAIITADCLKFRVNEKLANRIFVFYSLQTLAVKKQFGSITKGVAQKKISTQRFRNILLPLPPLSEQQRIVSELESKLTICDKIAETITQSLAQAETLRQSILKKAFEGKLVRSEPEKEARISDEALKQFAENRRLAEKGVQKAIAENRKFGIPDEK